MNPVEIYKRLPKSNCHKCPPGTCMGLAVAMARGDLAADACPELSVNEQAAVQALIPRPSDWRIELANSLLEELSGIDLPSRGTGLGLLTAAPGGCTLRFMGREVRVDRENAGPGLDPWDRILVLRYLLGPGRMKPTGTLKAFRDLKDGLVKAEAFRKECERPLARFFERYGEEVLVGKIEDMGGHRVSGQVAPVSMEVAPLPRIPLLLLIWPGDAEFGADAKVLLDETATSFLDVESLIFLGERMVARLEGEG